MKKILMTVLMAIAASVEAAVSVKSVTANQRYPWNGLVDIVVSLECSADDIAEVECTFAATNSANGAAVPVASITQNGVDVGNDTTWTRRFIWNAANDVGAVKIDDVALTVDTCLGVQLWENGPYWAKCNIGATKPEEYGYYFWWGDTVGYTREGGTWTSESYGSLTLTWYSDVTWVSSTGTRMGSSPFSLFTCQTHGKDNSALRSAGYIDSTGNLVAAHDAATVHLGAAWRMPTDAEFAALIDNCDTQWTTRGGVYGQLVTGRGAYASKSIFLPAAGIGIDSELRRPGSRGHYWSSTPLSDSSYAWDVNFFSGYFERSEDDRRYLGQSVRPLRGFAK